MKTLLTRRSAPALAILPGLVCAASLVGCGSSPYPVAPVSGRVLIDGEPYSAGKVMFTPVQSSDEPKVGKPAFAVLGDDGSFQLSTYGTNDGAVVGEHWVTLFSVKHRRTEAHKHIPKFDRIPAVTKPVEVLAAQDNQIDIELTLDEVKKFAR